MNRKTFFILAISLALSACAAKQKFNLFSIEQEKKMGDDVSGQLLAEFEKKGQVNKDPQVNEYVNRLGQKLALRDPGKQFSYRFHIITTPEVNAFAVPGGSLFIFTGLINQCQNEAELAAVIDHEIAHVILRHGTRQLSAKIAASVAADILLFGLSGKVDPQIAQLAVNVAATGAFLAYSRKDEREADDMGARLMHQAGYNPEAMSDFFARLAAKKGKPSEIERFLSDHPDPGNREKLIQELAAELGPTQNLKWDSPEFKAVHAKVSMLKYPKKPPPNSKK